MRPHETWRQRPEPGRTDRPDPPSRGTGPGAGPEPGGGGAAPDHNRATALRLGLTVALAFFLASHAPAGMVPAAFSFLAFVAGMTAAVMATIKRQDPWGPAFTHWDEAAVMALLSVLAAMLVDPAAVAVPGG